MDRDVPYGGGLGFSVFANLGEFTTNVTDSVTNETGCDGLGAVGYYELNFGAAAGPTLDFDTRHWIPVPETSIPVYTTTLTGTCASSTAFTSPGPSPYPNITNEVRDALTTTFTSLANLPGTRCLRYVVNCPASAQRIEEAWFTRTLATAVSSGVTPTFPITRAAGVANTTPFGTNAKFIAASTRSPVVYSPSATGWVGIDDGETGGVPKRTILGVSIGLGLLVLGAVIGVSV